MRHKRSRVLLTFLLQRSPPVFLYILLELDAVRLFRNLDTDAMPSTRSQTTRAIEGIEAGFIFHGLKSIKDGQDNCMAFQLYAPVAVRVYAPTIQQSQQNRVTCSCVDYQSSQSACPHLYVSQYLDSAERALICTVASCTLEHCVESRATSDPANLDADRSRYRIECSIFSNRATTSFLMQRSLTISARILTTRLSRTLYTMIPHTTDL